MFSIKIDLDLTILSLAIVFPLVFSITSDKSNLQLVLTFST